jgi:chaperone modulatory protein CbpM
MRVELTEVLWLEEHHELSLTELAELSGLTEAELREVVDCGAIAPIDPQAGTPTFRADDIAVARTAARLRHAFELDAQGLALAMALLDRVHDLEAQLRRLQAQVPGRHAFRAR